MFRGYSESRLKAGLAAMAALLSLVAYWVTLAPTLSFWDPGEYVAAAHILGIPHPPGAPFYMLMGRFSIILLPFQDVAMRMNFLSAFCGALTVGLVYLFTEKLLSMVFRDRIDRFSAHAAALCAAFLAAFSHTFWFTAVEAEKDTPSMLVLMLISWLSLLWAERRDRPEGARLLILIFYLAFLGFGLQNNTVITLPALVLLILTTRKAPDFNLPVVLLLSGVLLLFQDVERFVQPGMRAAMSWSLVAGALWGIFRIYRPAPGSGRGHGLLVLWFFATAWIGFLNDVALTSSSLILYFALAGSLPLWLLGRHLLSPEVRPDAPLGLAALALMAVIYDVGNFIWYGLGMLALSLVAYFLVRSPLWKRQWSLAAWLSAVALVGFSTFAYIPIRSALDPRIDENDPETYAAFQQFLERKQYGSESMLRRAFHRRGELENQFLSHPHMGYGGFALSQYLPWKVGGRSAEDNRAVERGALTFPTQMDWMGDNRLLQLLLLLLLHTPVAYACLRLYRRSAPIGTYAFLLYFTCSFGLVFYMNFSDGTQLELRDYQYWVQAGADPAQKPAPVHLEVRERDYFFQPAYVFLSVLLGAAVGAGLAALGRRGSARPVLRGAGVAALVVSLSLPVFSNYREQNRSGNYVPYDYAYNLLMSCGPNAILFTNGDNDTFPLWYLQEVEGVRLDVRVVNLSLANTEWYIRQMRQHEPKLDLGFTDQEIRTLQPRPWQWGESINWAIPGAGMEVKLDRQSYLKVQDIIVLNLVQNNFPKRPVHFASTVSEGNMMGLAPYLTLEGMVYTLTRERHNRSVNIARTVHLADSVYRYRGLGDPDVYIDANTEGMLTSYAALRYRVATAVQERVRQLQVVGDSAREERDSLIALAERGLEFNARILPREWRNHYYRAEFYRQLGNQEKALAALKAGLETGANRRFFGLSLAELLLGRGDTKQAESLLVELTADFPEDLQLAFGLSQARLQEGRSGEARAALDRWLQDNPQHAQSDAVRAELARMAQEPAQPAQPEQPEQPVQADSPSLPSDLRPSDSGIHDTIPQEAS